MDRPSVYPSCAEELRKIGTGKGVGELLSHLAERQGYRPSMFPSIKQVQHVATRDRGRAAEIASNIKAHLKSIKQQAVA
jgi:hypothetical protein